MEYNTGSWRVPMHPVVVLALVLALAERVEQAALCLCWHFYSFAKQKRDLQYSSLSQEFKVTKTVLLRDKKLYATSECLSDLKLISLKLGEQVLQTTVQLHNISVLKKCNSEIWYFSFLISPRGECPNHMCLAPQLLGFGFFLFSHNICLVEVANKCNKVVPAL